MERYKKFLILWLINVLLLVTFSILFPMNYALGNSLFTPLQAVVFAGLIWNLVIWYAGPFFEDLGLKLMDSWQMMMGYLLINFGVLWVLARLSVITGFGISSWSYVLGLAIVANVVQYFTWQFVDKK